MKAFEAILQYYGSCCIAESNFETAISERALKNAKSPSAPSEEEKEFMEQDKKSLAEIRGQKKALEWLIAP